VRHIALALTLTLAGVPVSAQVGLQPMFESGEALEAELHSDFNGDGHADIAYIVRGEERRELRVATTVVTDGEIGETPPQVLSLDPYPLGSARLSAKGNVLVLEDLTGGTTAVASTHRFRWDQRLGAMRLIGLDAALYSRTFAHGGQEASWNLLTGDLHTQTLRLRRDNNDIAYDKVDQRRRKRASQPLRLEQSPNGEDLLEWPGGR
jgi:hypothetical protein